MISITHKNSLRLIVAVLGLFAVGSYAAESDKSDSVRKANAVLTVNTTRPVMEQWPVTQLANGSLWAWQDAVIAAETGGLRITQLLADVGTEVKQGQKLAQLSQDVVLADIAQKQALVSQAKAELAEAQANAKRATEAKGGNAFSEQQINQYLISQDKAQASLAAAEAQLQNQQIRLQQTTITAVDDGVISSRSATLGAVVQAGTELFRQLRQNRLEWRAELMAEQLLPVRAGQKVRLRLTSGEDMEGIVRVVAPTFDPITRKAIVYVDLPKAGSARAGMFAYGEILLDQKPALTLPDSAIVLRDGYSYVFEIDNEQRVMQRKVTIGRRVNKRVEIIEGLKESAIVVASSGAFLNSGDTVRIAELNANKTDKDIQ